jgi:hypothetical protein
MDVVIRPVNDRFLNEVAFPAFEVGVSEARPAMERLLEQVNDARTQTLLETLIDRGVDGSLFALEADTWLEAAYRLLFSEWIPSVRGGWQLSAEYTGFASGLEEALHLALMVEDARYVYWDKREAQRTRIAYFGQPDTSRPLAALICGRWDPFPSFPPDQVLPTRGRDPVFRPMDEIAIADWTCRFTGPVAQLAASFPAKLANLLRRETDRLRPIAVPEVDHIYDFWMGRTPEPPLLTVAFSGLGGQSPHWVRDLGALVRVVRGACELEQGLTSILVGRNRGDTGDPF